MRVYCLKQLLLLFLLLTGTSLVYAQPGSNDPTFNTFDDGTYGDGLGFNAVVYSMVLQPDSKLVVGGQFTSYNGITTKSLARLNIDGSIDASFISDSSFNNSIRSIAIQPDGKIIVGGDFTLYNGISINKIARLNVDGSLDTSFSPGTGFNSGVYSVVLQPDGKVIAGGYFTSFNETAAYRIARLNIDGSLDTSFTIGSGFDKIVRSLAIQANGKIIAAGELTSYNGIAINKIARLHADGSLDSSFDPGAGFSGYASPQVASVVLQPDDKIIVGGWFKFFNGVSRNHIIRLNSDGSLDSSFDPGTGFDEAVVTIALQPDGKVITGGNFTLFNEIPRNAVSRLNIDGSLDTSFNSGSITVVSNSFHYPVYSTVTQPDGKIIVGGDLATVNGHTKGKIIRLQPDGSSDDLYNPRPGIGSLQESVIQPDGKIIAAGGFTSYNGISINDIIRLNIDGSLDSSFNPGTGINVSYIETIALQPDGKIIAGGGFTSFNGIDRKCIVRLNNVGTVDTSFNPGTGFYDQYWQSVNSVVLQPDSKIIAGGHFTYFNGTAINKIARLNVDGSLDTSFNPGAVNYSVAVSIIQPDGKIIAGGTFTSINGTAINRIVRLNSDGSLDASFNSGTGFNSIVRSTTIQSDGKIIVGGDFTSYNGTAINRIARLNTDGSLDVFFNPGAGFNHSVRSIIVQPNGKIIVGGDFTLYNGVTKNKIVRLNADGSLDNSFNSGTGFNKAVYSTVLQSDGKIIVGGGFTSFNGIWRNGIARLYGDGEYPHFINGYLYDDASNDCAKQTGETGLFYPVTATPGNHYTVANDTGYYSLGIHDSINYTITPVIPQRFLHMVKNPCPANYSVFLDSLSSTDTSGFDFGFEYNPCHQLRVDVSSNRRRRCMSNITRVFYTNEGLIAADSVEVHVKMPQHVIPVSASMSYTWSSDSNMVFNIGVLNAGQSGYITITDSVACVSGIVGLTQCTKAWITPPNTCLMDSTTGAGWDKSSVKVEGACVNDTVRFVIYNTGDPGTGDMTGTSEYRIYADNALMQTGTFQLAGGDSLVVTVVSGGATIRLEADQRPGHPGFSQPRETVEACGTDSSGTFSVGMVAVAVQDDEDVHVEVDCLPIIDSYDPNDKQATPAGIGPNKIVMPGTALDYTIRFQNTGTDTAYKVVVVDTLSSYLDLSTLELGTSSFPYSFKLSGAGRPVLTFTFNNINLTDTFTNEAGSHGFVKFRISPYDTVAIGTEVTNNADIFFDYNDPIRTNDAQVTIDTFTYTSAYLANVVAQPVINSFYCSGDSVVIAPAFSGTGVTYQWYKDNTPLAGKTDSILIINAASLSDTGYYFARVTGHLNSKTTDIVRLIINYSESTLSETACNSYTLNSQTYTSGGTYIQTLVNAAGCDSILTLNLTVKNSTTSAFNESACNSYTLNGMTYDSTGVYTQILTNTAGCDSTITLNLTVENSTASSLTETACDSYTLNSQTYTSGGTYTQTLANAAGCDSTVTLNLTLNNSTVSTLNEAACNSYTLNGQTYNTSGTYTQMLVNTAGCDSTITLNLALLDNENTFNETACNSYTLNGQTYTTSGAYTQTLTNAAGCDSTITLNLTVENSTASSLTETACDSYTLNSQTYTSGGTYTQTLANAAGCDSTVTLNLTLNNSTVSTLNEAACNSYTLNGQTYNTSGTYTQMLVNAAGCDSTITLNLALLDNENTFNETACNSYTLNGQTYTTSGAYTQTLTNAAGCDSTITLNLTITTADTSVTQSQNILTANATGAAYQWIDCDNDSLIAGETNQSFTATGNGSYAVVVTENGCIDTSACYAITGIGIMENSFGAGLMVFPNPTNGKLSIDLAGSYKGITVQVRNIAGQLVFKESFGSKQLVELNLESLANGIYMIRIAAADKSAVVRVVKGE